MQWKYARDIFFAIVGYFVSGVLAFLGLAPEAVIARVWGAEIVISFVKTMVNFDHDALRWWFVVVSYGTLCIAIAFTVLIPLRKANN